MTAPGDSRRLDYASLPPLVLPVFATQSELISEHATAADAFAVLDAYAARCAEQGLRGDYCELRVIDGRGREVRRPWAQ
jgi:hypothetical protein